MAGGQGPGPRLGLEEGEEGVRVCPALWHKPELACMLPGAGEKSAVGAMMAVIEGLTQGPGRRRVEKAPLGRFLPHAVALTAKGSQWDPCSDPWSSQAFALGGIGEEGRRPAFLARQASV